MAYLKPDREIVCLQLKHFLNSWEKAFVHADYLYQAKEEAFMCQATNHLSKGSPAEREDHSQQVECLHFNKEKECMTILNILIIPVLNSSITIVPVSCYW